MRKKASIILNVEDYLAYMQCGTIPLNLANRPTICSENYVGEVLVNVLLKYWKKY